MYNTSNVPKVTRSQIKSYYMSQIFQQEKLLNDKKLNVNREKLFSEPSK